MNVYTFDWDENNEEHIAEHGVNITEVEEAILFQKPFYQKTREGKYVAYAVTDDGRHLFVVFVIRERSHVRVITARDMTERERRYYRKRKGAK